MKKVHFQKKTITAKRSEEDKMQHVNKIDQTFVDYVENMDKSFNSNLGFTRTVNMNLLRKTGDEVKPVSFSNQADSTGLSMSSAMASMTGIGVSSFPTSLDSDENDFLKDNYTVLAGNYPKKLLILF